MSNRASHLRMLHARQNGLCHWCDKLTFVDHPLNAHNRATVDHVFTSNDPRRAEAVRGDGIIRNVVACRTCNQKRGDLPYDVFLVLVRPEWRGVLDIAATMEA